MSREGWKGGALAPPLQALTIVPMSQGLHSPAPRDCPGRETKGLGEAAPAAGLKPCPASSLMRRAHRGGKFGLAACLIVFLEMGGSASFSRAEVLDRVVASIGDVAITQSDVECEYRLERFLDGQWPPPPADGKTLDQARERLVYQKLLLEEETQDLSRLPTLEKTAGEELDGLRKRFPSEQDYRSALQSLHMDEKQILTTLIDQQRILRIIEEQLRPAAAPGTPEVESYYRDVFTPEYTRTHSPPVPSLTEVEGQIREILAQKKIDQLLASWLEELKPSRRVHFYSF